ncbi:MAG: error-prone DNA polymerase [Pseudomonadota bacterium]|nr:error-prone DNA polymerase [Pseudomonadota bacterium]
MPRYAELEVTTNFSFLHSASHVEEIAKTSAALGLSAISVTDRNTLAGIVRAHRATKETGIRLIVGARLDLQNAPSLLCFPTNRNGYAHLSQLITLGRRRAPKGECEIYLEDVFAHYRGQIFVSLPPDITDKGYTTHLHHLREVFGRNLWLAARYRYNGNDATRLCELAQQSTATNIPMVATNDVRMHVPDRKPLMDAITCIREHCTIDQAGFRLAANAERHIKPPEEMARLFRLHPEAIIQTMEITDRCRFSLDELRYEYPDDEVPPGTTPQEELVRLSWEGAQSRYPDGPPDDVCRQIAYELKLIRELNYAPYFLTVHDIVRFARSQGILCQGRGSAANSAVCYCLGITAIDPSRIDLLFERFVSAERNEPPDIDVDFEHERREEVIQYIYEKYGRERAGLAATVIHYRTRMALREIGKVMGLSKDTTDTLVAAARSWRAEDIKSQHIHEAGLNPDDKRLSLAIHLASELTGFPRHLSQHVGGFVITRGPLSDLVPIANAAMEGRTTIEWDKDDLDTLGILKVDILGLGILSCIRKSFNLLEQHYDRKIDLATVPPEDPAVYDMLCQADSVGVFQVESRAQMTMLPRLKPRNFYDLVIEVAIVRPGPIQGDMVHPYLRRRNGEEKTEYPSKELREVLGKTYGVPLFQEQAMKIAIIAGGFTPSEADQLRRAMATFRHTGTIHTFEEKLVNGMLANGYDADFAEHCFNQIKGFGDYGFPESHAASFALLVYVSSWLKKHYPDVFAGAILNSQPMGFYAPAQLVRDALEHGVEVRPADVNFSNWDNTLENNGTGYRALRLGFRQIKGFPKKDATAITDARDRPFRDPTDIQRRARLTDASLERLAMADAYGSMKLGRRDALWAVRALPPAPLPLFEDGEHRSDPDVSLPIMAIGEEVIHDYTTLRMSLKSHPLALLREELDAAHVMPNDRLIHTKDETRVTVAGITLVRQRPSTASGVIFITLEDETGIANLIIWPKIFEKFRPVIMNARLIRVTGKLQREGIVVHIIAEHLEDATCRLHALGEPEPVNLRKRINGTYENNLARADEVKNPFPGSRRSTTRKTYPSRDFK